jgi:RND family efflux transporter MFP subunit
MRILLTTAALLLIASTGPMAAAQAPQMPPSLVVVAPVVAQEVTSGSTFVGTVTPTRRAVIGSAVDGRVIEFPCNEGDRVEAGQTLAQLLTETIKLELAAAEAELDFRRQQLAEMENGTRPQEIEQFRARVAAAESRARFLEARRARTEAAFRVNRAASEDELEQAASLAAEAEQNHLEAKAAYEMAVEGPRKELIAQSHAQVAVQEAVVEKLRDQFTKHTIISRFTGYVVAEHTEEGQWVKSGDLVAEVVELDTVEIEVHVVEQYVPYISVGQEVRVEIPALGPRIFTGTVALIVPQADVRARTFPVKVRVINEITPGGPLIKSGMLARVTLATGAKQDALLVPKDALVLGGETPMVYIVNTSDPAGKTGQVAPVPVELGVATGKQIQVTGALTAGQLVVVQGNERLRPGQAVAVVRVIDDVAAASPSQSTAP